MSSLVFKYSQGNNFFITLLFFITSIVYPQEIVNLDSNAVLSAGTGYEKGFFYTIFAGEHYRKLWSTPFNAKYLDLSKYAGGLSPIKEGGGRQTRSLKFQAKNGKIYKFRSLDKDPGRSLPKELQDSFVEEVLKDQISVSVPVASLIINPILDSLQILNSKPELFILPDSELLGEFRNDFRGMLGTIEEDPNDYGNASLNFASADKINGSEKFFQKLYDDNDEKINAIEFLKARLVDILIGDRDRHAGQWDWAGFEQGKMRIWKPIPKDRDYAFPLYDGLVPWILRLSIFSIVHFSQDLPAVFDITYEGRHLDRRLLSELTLSNYDSLAYFIQNTLTDSIIISSVEKMPPELFEIEGNTLISKLISRRDQLNRAAREYYFLLAKYVDVYGSNKREFAEIIRLNDSQTSVKLFDYKKDSDEIKTTPFFSRIFNNSETKELRIHLLDGDDKIKISGMVDNAILIRAIGGNGKDIMIDSSDVSKSVIDYLFLDQINNKTIFYDSGNKSEFIEGNSTIINTDEYEESSSILEDLETAQEDRGYQFGLLFPLDVNSDDGLVLGLGGELLKYNFRKSPYDFRLSFYSAYATSPNAFQGFIEWDLKNIIRNTTLNFSLNATQFGFLKFYGMGNNSNYFSDDEVGDYFKINQQEVNFISSIILPLNTNLNIKLYNEFSFSKFNEKENTILEELSIYGKDEIIKTSFGSALIFDTRDNKYFPHSGLYNNIYGEYSPSIFKTKENYYKFGIDLRTYFRGSLIDDFVIALRFKGEKILNKYPFYESASLGGKNSLRGYTRDRFRGDASILLQTEIRHNLMDVNLFIP